MNKHVNKVIAGAVIIVLSLIICFSGCGSEETQKQIETLQVKVENTEKSVTEEANKALANLEAAKTELESLISSGDNKSAEDLSAAVGKLEAAIKTAQEALEKADGDMKTEFSTAVGELESAIKASQEALEKADGDMKTEFSAAVEELESAIKALEDTLKTVIIENEFESTTEAVIEKLAELDEKYEQICKLQANYSPESFEKITRTYNNTIVKLYRAVNSENAQNILNEYDKEIAAIPSITDTIYNALKAIEDAGVTDSANCKASLDKAEELLNSALSSGVQSIVDEVKAYGDKKIDLWDWYTRLLTEYNECVAKSSGDKLKARMDSIIAKTITLDIYGEAQSIRNDFNNWSNAQENADESIKLVEGFKATIEKFEKVEARLEVLKEAKVSAADINKKISELKSAGIKADIATLNAINDIQKDIDDWCRKYSIVINPEASNYIKENYDLINHDEFDALRKAFDLKVEKLKAYATDFIAKVKAIGEESDINLNSGDAISAARVAYAKWTSEDAICDFGQFKDAIYNYLKIDNPADYYTKLVSLDAEYRYIQKQIAEIESRVDALENNSEYPYFANDAEKEAYAKEVEDIQAAMQKFLTTDENNNVVVREYTVSAKALVKLTECAIIPAKYDAVKAINNAYAEASKDVEEGSETDERLKIAVEYSIEQVKLVDVNAEYASGDAYAELIRISTLIKDELEQIIETK